MAQKIPAAQARVECGRSRSGTFCHSGTERRNSRSSRELPAWLSFHDYGSCAAVTAARGHNLRAIAWRRHLRQFGANILEWHSHQRGGDLSLLIKIACQTLGRNNRLFECWRIETHSSRTKFRNPSLGHGCFAFTAVCYCNAIGYFARHQKSSQMAQE